MRNQAHITTVEALDSFRAEVREFQQTAMKELMSMQQDVRKMEAWVTLDQPPRWKMRIRKIEAQVNNARSDLERAKIARPDQSPRMFVEQRKALQRAQANQQTAMDRIRSLKKWAAIMPRESMLMQSGLRSLGNSVEGDMTRLISMLKVLADHLEEYLRMSPPPSGFDKWATEMRDQEADFARSGEESNPLPDGGDDTVENTDEEAP